MVKFSDPSFQNAYLCSLYHNDFMREPKPRRTKIRKSYPTTSKRGSSSKTSSSTKTRGIGSDVSFPSLNKATSNKASSTSNKAAVSDDAYKSSLLQRSKECTMENDVFIKMYEATRCWFDDDDDENKMPNCKSDHSRRSTNGFREFDDGTTKLTVKQHSYDHRLGRSSSSNNIFWYDAMNVNDVSKPIHRRELMTSNNDANTKLTVVNSKLSDLNDMKEFAASMRRRIKSHSSSLLLTNKGDGTTGTTGESEMGGCGGGGVPAGDAPRGCDDNRKSSKENNTANGMNNSIRSRLATVTQRSNEGLRQQELVGMGCIKNKVASRVRSAAKYNDSEIIDSLIVAAGSESGIHREEDDDANASKRKELNKKTQAQSQQHYSEEERSKTYDLVLERDAAYKTNKTDIDEWWADRQRRQRRRTKESSEGRDTLFDDLWGEPGMEEDLTSLHRESNAVDVNAMEASLSSKQVTQAKLLMPIGENQLILSNEIPAECSVAYKTSRTHEKESFANTSTIPLSVESIRSKQFKGHKALNDEISSLERSIRSGSSSTSSPSNRHMQQAMVTIPHCPLNVESIRSKLLKGRKSLNDEISLLERSIRSGSSSTSSPSNRHMQQAMVTTPHCTLNVESIRSKHFIGRKALNDEISSLERSIRSGSSSSSSSSNRHLQQATVTIPHCPDTPRGKPMDSFHTPSHNNMRVFAFTSSYDQDESPSLAAASTLSEDETQVSTSDQSLIVLFVRIEETKASLTRALLDANAEEQNRLEELLTRLEDLVVVAMRNA